MNNQRQTRQRRLSLADDPAALALADDPAALALALDELHELVMHSDRPVHELWQMVRISRQVSTQTRSSGPPRSR